MVFIVLSSLETVHGSVQYRFCIFIVLSSLVIVHDTVQYRYSILSLLYRLLRIRLKRQNTVLSFVRERERGRERENTL
jgi:hypothetical protein